jgi:predicted double-glycine peptidase
MAENSEIPLEYFQFVSVRGGKGVRISLTDEFEQRLSESRGKIVNTIDTITHVTSNPSAEWPPQRMAAERSQLNREVFAKTDFTFDQIEAEMDRLETALNAQPNPIGAATKLGMKRLLRKREE